MEINFVCKIIFVRPEDNIWWLHKCWVRVLVFMSCESQFSDVIIPVEVVSLIGLSGQRDSLSSLHLAFRNRRYVTVLLTGTLSQHLLDNV